MTQLVPPLSRTARTLPDKKQLPLVAANPANGSAPCRREFLARSALAAAGLVSAGADARGAGGNDSPSASKNGPGGVTDTSASPHVVLQSVGLADARWTRGF